MEVNKIYNEDCLTGLKRLPDNLTVVLRRHLIMDCEIMAVTVKLVWRSHLRNTLTGLQRYLQRCFAS